jgi:deoxyribose-phosphate aldolase
MNTTNHCDQINLFSLIDLTLLKASNNPEQEESLDEIFELCEKAKELNCAAICCYPYWVSQAKARLNHCKVNVATVINFPHGKDSLAESLSSIEQAIKKGADEIDLVLPYHLLFSGKKDEALSYVKACRKMCAAQKLKVIIESGELKTPTLIQTASEICIAAEADFIKTSTGKVAQGASLEAAKIILNSIKKAKNELIGIKLSGGIRTQATMHEYLDLIDEIMGKLWVTPAHVRFGMSRLPE